MKKVFYIILFFLIFLSFNVYAYPQGDVDGDGIVRSNDYILIRKHILKIIELSGNQRVRADVNGDGIVSSLDYIAIRKIIIGGGSVISTPTPTANPSTKITAQFINSDTSASSETIKEISCYAIDNNGCNITIPNLSVNTNYQFLGWNTDSKLKEAKYLPNNTLLIKNDITLYAIVPKIITITFNVSDNVAGKNVKAEKFAFTYTDTNGNTVIEKEGIDNISTTCLSFNNEGCKINKLPVIYAKGYMVHGYSKTIGGKNMSATTTTFKEDTTIYARVGYYNSIEIGYANIAYQKLYGSMMLEIETGISQTYINKVVSTLDKIYLYYPEVFYPGGKIFILNSNTYNRILKNAYSQINTTAGHSITATNYNNCFIRVDSDLNSMMETLVHEMGHSFDNTFGKYISDTQELNDLYNKYKNMNNRPFRSYTYSNNMEFVADIFSATISNLMYQKTGEYIHSYFHNIPSDISALIVSNLSSKRSNYKNIGLIK